MDMSTLLFNPLTLYVALALLYEYFSCKRVKVNIHEWIGPCVLGALIERIYMCRRSNLCTTNGYRYCSNEGVN